MLLGVQQSIESLGDCIGGKDRAQQGAVLLRVISSFTNGLQRCVEGNAVGDTSLSFHSNELYGGARIFYIFNEMFGSSIQTMDTFDDLSDDDIRTAIANANGAKPSLFVPQSAFELLVKRQISRLKLPGKSLSLTFTLSLTLSYSLPSLSCLVFSCLIP